MYIVTKIKFNNLEVLSNRNNFAVQEHNFLNTRNAVWIELVFRIATAIADLWPIYPYAFLIIQFFNT